MTVNGVVDLPAADSLFQAIGTAPGSAPIAPPDNVVLLPAALFSKLFPAGAPGVTTQLHIELARTLPADPGAAFAQVVGRAKNLEAALSGSGLIGDNLAARLDAARSDAVYAQLLFLFLGLPGVVLAALLAAVVSAAGRERRRQEQALVRMRGGSTGAIVRLAAAEAVTVGSMASLLGLGAAVVAGHVAFGASGFGATTSQAWAWTAMSVVVGIGLALITIVLPAASDARLLTVGAARATIGEVVADMDAAVRRRRPTGGRWPRLLASGSEWLRGGPCARGCPDRSRSARSR